MPISLERAVAAGVFAALTFGTAVSAGEQQQQTTPQREAGPATNVAARPISPEVISGSWDYNDALSVDAATGRAERAPRSATQRATQPGAAPPAGGGSAPVPPRTGGGGSGGGGDFEGRGPRDGFDEARRAMAAVIAAERRTYVRDLLEVPEILKIRASAGEVTEVTIADDLGRERTFVADGKLQKYQLAAARFEARATWTETYFRKEIEGSNGFKMSETYFVSEDGRRLFVIIRVGDPKKPETLAGINRVYDRIGAVN